jgi:predicted nucleic acid-binding protein
MKIKLYLDTCIFGVLDKERKIKTNEFFKFVSKNHEKYELVISQITIAEIDNANEVTKNKITDFIEAIKITELPENNEAIDLAKEYIKTGILGEKHYADLLHIAYATLTECDILVSWNRKHLAKLTTMQKVNKFNLDNNLRMIIIETPQFFISKEN